MTSDASTLELATDPLGFAVKALADVAAHVDDDASTIAHAQIAAARKALAVVKPESFPTASTHAARILSVGVRTLVLNGQPVARAEALEAVAAAEQWLEGTGQNEQPAQADAQEARGVARRVAAEQPDALDARMLEAAAMDLLAAAQKPQTAGNAEASARTDLEIAEVFTIYPAEDRAPLIERAVGHARRAAATLTPEVDATSHARCQLLLSGLLLDHPRTDPQQFAPAAAGLADIALTVVDAERAPLVAARAWKARARALELSGSGDHEAGYTRAAELLDAAGLAAESRRLRRRDRRP